MIRLRRGVNLGGWMSQCDYSEERLNSFISERDLDRIASWGADHVRLPIDYNVLESEDGLWKEDGWDRISRAVDQCLARGLNILLDLHKTAGFCFDAQEAEEGFFDSEEYQERFYRRWEEFARRFGGKPDQVAFDLLNEVTEEEYMSAWNRIARECVRRIRVFAPETLILLGSCHYNGIAEVALLNSPPDDRVAYSFHCYEPKLFTHQGAYWMDEEFQKARNSFADWDITPAWFEALLAPALEKAAAEGASLYCGEYGVIDVASPEDTVKYYRALHEALEKHGIGRSAWSYKEMDFGLADPRMDRVRDELIKYL